VARWSSHAASPVSRDQDIRISEIAGRDDWRAVDSDEMISAGPARLIMALEHEINQTIAVPGGWIPY
jgi:hypothetical protein